MFCCVLRVLRACPSPRTAYDAIEDESSILEPPAQELDESFKLEFEIVSDSTKRGRPKLVDNRGYTYNIQRRRGENTDWQCTVRPKVDNSILC